jgi:hypothetical protein
MRDEFSGALPEDDREAKLPVWAKDMLRQMRARVRAAEKAAVAARLATDPEGSAMIMAPYSEVPIGLGAAPTVRVKLGKGGYIDFRKVQGEDVVEVLASTTLAITPQASNVVRLRDTEVY